MKITVEDLESFIRKNWSTILDQCVEDTNSVLYIEVRVYNIFPIYFSLYSENERIREISLRAIDIGKKTINSITIQDIRRKNITTLQFKYKVLTVEKPSYHELISSR